MTAPWKSTQEEGGNPFLRYFDAEMRYLREAGREFARDQPEAARRLGMQYGQEDDKVRALNEGFAFLSARLRMKLDDGMQEMTDPVLDNLFEHMARAIPSLSIIECAPLNRGAKVAQIAPGAVVRSAPIGPDEVQCTFRTTQAVDLLPLSVEDSVLAVRPDGRTVIRLTFGLWFGDQREHPDLSRIRLYLHGDRPAAAALYAALTRQIAAIGLRLPSVRDGSLVPLDGVHFEPAGFGPSTRLWPVLEPKRDQELDREQTLLEYFVFPQKFHFVDLCGFDSAMVPAGETRMTFEIELDGRMPGDQPVGRESFRLFCTPVINLFEVDALPLQPTDWHDKEHRVRMPPSVDRYVEPYDLLEVIAADPEGSARHAYKPFKSFRHRGWTLTYDKPERYFHTATRYGVVGRELWINLSGQLWAGIVPHAQDDDRPPHDRHITMRTLANNGRLPRMALAEAMINEPVSGFTGVASVRSVAAPSLPQYPPRYYPGYDWRVLGHYTANGANELSQMVMEGAPVLREVLELYDWTPDAAVPQRIDAIRTVHFSERQEILGRGDVLRIACIHVDLDASGFDGPGDAVLFGDVLSYFLGRYATVHCSMQLMLTIDGKETVYPRTDFTGAPF